MTEQVRASDPTLDSGMKEVAFVDTSVADYKTLEAGIQAGVEIEEIGSGQDGLSQIAKWAESHSGYDAIHILGYGAEGTVHLGSGILSEAALAAPATRAELAELWATP